MRTLLIALCLFITITSTANAVGWRKHNPNTVIYPPSTVTVETIFPQPVMTTYWYRVDVPTNYYRIDLKYGVIYKQPYQAIVLPWYQSGVFTWQTKQRHVGYGY